MEPELVAGRSCGTCTVCCTALTIDQPELQKLAGVTCAHCATGQGCTVYQARPHVCRTWFCAWRTLAWVGDGLRPDLSDVLVYPTTQRVPAGYDGEIGLEFLIRSRDGLQASGLAETLHTAMSANIACFLLVPARAGYAGARWLLNGVITLTSNAAMLRELRKLYLGSLFLGEAEMTAPVMMSEWGPRGTGPLYGGFGLPDGGTRP